MEMPHERLLDLAAIYRMVLTGHEECKIHFAVTHSFCKMYEISIEELAAAAKKDIVNISVDRLWPHPKNPRKEPSTALRKFQ